jgi:hypothetical protein
VQHPLGPGEGGREGRQVAAERDRVDQRRARTVTPQLDEVGALRVPEAGRPFGVDGDGPAAALDGGGGVAERSVVDDDRRQPVGRPQQRDRRRAVRVVA